MERTLCCCTSTASRLHLPTFAAARSKTHFYTRHGFSLDNSTNFVAEWWSPFQRGRSVVVSVQSNFGFSFPFFPSIFKFIFFILFHFQPKMAAESSSPIPHPVASAIQMFWMFGFEGHFCFVSCLYCFDLKKEIFSCWSGGLVRLGVQSRLIWHPKAALGEAKQKLAAQPEEPPTRRFSLFSLVKKRWWP